MIKKVSPKNFLPEIKQYDSEYAEIKTKNLLKFKDNQNYASVMEFLQFVMNNQEQHILYRKLNYNPSNIHKLIRNDEINEFQLLLSRKNINVNECIPFSYYERAKTNDKNISFIKAAALYDSIKIFKFLWQQPDIVIESDLINYAYCGRNLEIIHICEKKCESCNTFSEVLFLHQEDFLEYTYDKYNNEITDDNKENIDENGQYPYLKAYYLNDAVNASNYTIIKTNIFKIMSIAKN